MRELSAGNCQLCGAENTDGATIHVFRADVAHLLAYSGGGTCLICAPASLFTSTFTGWKGNALFFNTTCNWGKTEAHLHKDSDPKSNIWSMLVNNWLYFTALSY